MGLKLPIKLFFAFLLPIIVIFTLDAMLFIMESRPSVIAYCIIQSIFLVLGLIWGLLRLICLLFVAALTVVTPVPPLPPGSLSLIWLGDLFLSGLGLLMYLLVEGLIGGLSDLTWRLFVILLNILPRVDINTNTSTVTLGHLLNYDWNALFPNYSYDTGMDWVPGWDGLVEVDMEWLRNWLVANIDSVVLIRRSWFIDTSVFFHNNVIDFTRPPSSIFFNDILGINAPFTEGVYAILPDESIIDDPVTDPPFPDGRDGFFEFVGLTPESVDRWLESSSRFDESFTAS